MRIGLLVTKFRCYHGLDPARFESDEFISHKKEAHDNKVHVRPFLSLEDGNVVPNGDKEDTDDNVTIMVRAILDDRVIQTALDVSKPQICTRRKRKISVPMNDSDYSTNPKVKDQQTNCVNEHRGASSAVGNVTQDTNVFSVFCKRWLPNGNHWVALDLDLGKETIHVYDSILTLVDDDKDIKKKCKPFAKLVPVILNEMVGLLFGRRVKNSSMYED